MFKRIMRLFLVLMILSGVISCKKSDNSKLLPPISGRAGEVVLIIEDELFDGFIGDSIANVLTKEEIALPQTGMQGAEPIFDLVQLPPNAFTNAFRSNRNIVITKLNPELSEGVMKVERDYWAFQQLLIRLEAPTKEALVELLDKKEDEIVETIREAEISRQVYLNKKFVNSELHRSLLENHKIITYFPKGYAARVDTGNFAWIQHDPQEIIQGLLLWEYPYGSEDQIDYANLVIKQDEMLKSRVPGEIDGSYMAIEFEHAPIHSRTFSHKGNYVREIKGLWEMENGFMGGPFVSWTLIDEKENRLVTLFGFVYAPKYNKRNHIRKIESLLQTVDFPD